MNKAYIKICGIQPGDNLDFTKEPQVSHIGFVFEKTSSRYVRPSEARSLISQMDLSCKPVGVFRNQSPSRIAEICKEANIKTVQLHGNEPKETCRKLRTLGFSVWKCISIPVIEPSIDTILEIAKQYVHEVDALLLDSSVRKNHNHVIEGGSGAPFSWSLLGGENGLISKLKPAKVWVAGGIKPENIASLLSICDPFGIDISSGVELEGRKSMDRIQEILKVVSSRGASYSCAR